jgi:AcrR family transcriptional regulator
MAVTRRHMPGRSQRPDQILDAALTLFDKRGYPGTRMADIAEALGIQAPSLYNHVQSKQALLRAVMVSTMETLIADHETALRSTDDPAEQLRRAMDAHVRYHARFPREAHVGNREITSLEEPDRSYVLTLRRDYAHSWQRLIERGVEEGLFDTPSPRLASYALLEMGIGVSMWFRPDGELSESEVAYTYADMALRIVAASAEFVASRRPAPSSSHG